MLNLIWTFSVLEDVYCIYVITFALVLHVFIFCISVPGGELQRVLDDEECVPERDAARLLRQILSGVAFLHEHNIAHLDLKVSHFSPLTPDIYFTVLSINMCFLVLE